MEFAQYKCNIIIIIRTLIPCPVERLLWSWLYCPFKAHDGINLPLGIVWSKVLSRIEWKYLWIVCSLVWKTYHQQRCHRTVRHLLRLFQYHLQRAENNQSKNKSSATVWDNFLRVIGNFNGAGASILDFRWWLLRIPNNAHAASLHRPLIYPPCDHISSNHYSLSLPLTLFIFLDGYRCVFIPWCIFQLFTSYFY